MTLEDWDKQNHWLKKEATSKEEIAGLLRKAERNLEQAANSDIDEEWRLAMAFASALHCATIALRAEGYRLPVEPGHHEKTISSLRYTINPNPELIDKLQSFRKKRGIVMYDSSGTAFDSEVVELIKHAKELRDALKKWLKDKHPGLLK